MSIGGRVCVVALCLLAGAANATAVSVEVIGTTRLGRPIKAVHVGSSDGPRVLIVGCIHGNECAARSLVNPLITARLPVDLWIVPTINPDGFAWRTRQNAAGVDLNRNWPRRWRRAGRPWSTYYSGPRSSSEPETVAGRRLIARIRPQVTIWYHQHLDLVWASGKSVAAGRIYARSVGMSMRTDDTIRGTASGWQRMRFPEASAFVVELPSGRMSSTDRTRHVMAVAAVAAAIPAG